MLAEVVTLYRYGYDIENIAYSLSIEETEVYLFLQQYKEQNSVAKGTATNDTFKRLVVDRILAGVNRSDILKELNVSWSTIYSSLRKFGLENMKANNKKKIETESEYSEIEWDSFEQCPVCKQTDTVNNVSNPDDDGRCNSHHSFCVSCNEEWFEENGVTLRVNWEYVE